MKKRHKLLLAVVLTLLCIGASYPSDERPLRVGIFIGVDDVTLSQDVSKFALFKNYRHREVALKVSRSELISIVNSLMTRGFANDVSVKCPDGPGIPPQTYEIRITWPKKEIVHRWYHADGCQAPEKYLEVLNALERTHKQPLIRKFIDANREKLSF